MLNSLVDFCFRKIKTGLWNGLRSLAGLLSASPIPAWWQSWQSHLYTDGCSRWKSGRLPWLSSSLAKAISIFLSVLSPHHCLSEKTQVGCSDIVSLISFRVVITEHRVQQGRKLQAKQNCLREGGSHQLCFFPSVPVLFHQQIAHRLHKVLRNKNDTFFTQVHMVVFLKYV